MALIRPEDELLKLLDALAFCVAAFSPACRVAAYQAPPEAATAPTPTIPASIRRRLGLPAWLTSVASVAPGGGVCAGSSFPLRLLCPSSPAE